MNIPKVNVRIIGLTFASTLLIPPNQGLNILGINFEDLPLIILFILLIYNKLTKFVFTNYDKLFIVFISTFILYTNIFTNNFKIFNQTNLRFYFYFILAYLCVDILRKSDQQLIKFFEPLSIVMVANFIVAIFQIDFPGTIDGWIPNNTGSMNPFTSGRLGGFQGGGPNVVGLLSAIYVLICIYKITSSKHFLKLLFSNKLNTGLLLISGFNLYITYSRGSYLALAVGLMVLLIYTDNLSKKEKKITLMIGVVLSFIVVSLFPSIFLKQSNRSFLNSLAVNNIELISGIGGGNYIKEVYKEYLVTLDEEELRSRFNITYSKEEIELFVNVETEETPQETKGFLKLKFDYKDRFLPRTVISFYHSSNGSDWYQIGSNHTSGTIINLIKNDSYFELGGWGDGQSPGGSYLDGHIKNVKISTLDKSFEYRLTPENRDKDYFLYLPTSTEFYDNRNDGRIIYNDYGIKLKRPRSYWVALPNQVDISKQDFEVVVELKINNIPKGNETIFSQSSVINSSDFINNQSWKWSIIDGRMYFFWIDNVTSGYSNYLGGQSLRSGELISVNGNFDSTISEFSLSQYDEITTSHSGFLTMAVEYGFVITLLIVVLIIYLLFKNLYQNNQLEISIFLMLLTQNLTNDIIYSPDIAIYFWILPSYFLSKVLKD